MARIPIIVKHCALAIFKKGGIDGGTTKEKFQSAWNIARARLTEYGYLGSGSEKGSVDNIRLTGKGRARETFHLREAGGNVKNMQFDKLYKLLQEDNDTDDG